MGFVVHILCKMPARRAAAVAGLEPGGGSCFSGEEGSDGYVGAVQRGVRRA